MRSTTINAQPTSRMRWRTGSALLIAFAAAQVEAASSFDCLPKVAGRQFDLTALNGKHSVTVTKSTPPTETRTTYDVSLCSPLEGAGAGPEVCPAGTRICATTTNVATGLDDRLIAVVPIAGDIGQGDLNVITETRAGDKKADTGFVLKIGGGKYVDERQSALIEVVCEAASKDSAPEFVSYEKGLLSLKWRTEYGCAKDSKTPPPPSGGNSSGGSGFFGWFFFLLFLAFAAYFVGGAYHRYTKYGSTGWDAIPHRDVWRDLPYVLKDLFTGRGGSRSGYAAL